MTVKEMKARLRAIAAEAKALPEGERDKLDKLLEEANDLNDKIDEADARARLSAIAAGIGDDGGMKGEGGASADDASKRGEQLKARAKVQYKNALTVEKTALTRHASSDVKETFNNVSSLIDRVKVTELPGGESYRRGYVKGYGDGAGYTNENADYNETEPEFAYADMTKTKVTAYCEEPEEIAKLPNANYDTIVASSTERAIRRYLSRQILVGEGGTGKLVGIFYNPTSEADDIIDRKTDIALEKIDENTLDDIIYAYGGDEDVESEAVLILSKADLQAFAKCRHADGKKAYTIVNRGNTGTIDGIPYIVNSACGAVSGADTANDKYCMAYGSLSNYELAVFSDMDVQRSTEYKFKQGQVAFRADIFVGGNVAAYNGFVRVKKKTAE